MPAIGSRLAFVLLALALAACETPGPQVAPPAAAVRARLGTIAVVPVTRVARRHAETPVAGPGEGFLVGARQGGGGVIRAGGEIGGAYGMLAGIFLSPAFAVIGGAMGAANAHDDDEVAEAAATLRLTLSERIPGIDLRDALVAAGIRDTDHRIVGRDPATDKATLAAEGIDTALELEVTQLGLETAGEIDPDVTLYMVARARLLRASDGSRIYDRTWGYRSEPFGYFDAAKDGGGRFAAEISAAVGALADAMTDDLFLSESPAPLSLAATEGTAAGHVVTVAGPFGGPATKETPRRPTGVAAPEGL